MAIAITSAQLVERAEGVVYRYTITTATQTFKGLTTAQAREVHENLGLGAERSARILDITRRYAGTVSVEVKS